MEETTVPTLYEWAGGMPAFERLTDLLYKRVPNDPLLGPVFAQMSAEHPRHVAWFIAEVMGGPKAYTTAHAGNDTPGGHAIMVRHHMGRHLTEQQRSHWIRTVQECADEVGFPTDPEFRSAFLAYLEWGSRLAVINSQDGAEAPPPDSPMPTWGWGEVKGPYRPEK